MRISIRLKIFHSISYLALKAAFDFNFEVLIKCMCLLGSIYYTLKKIRFASFFFYTMFILI